MFERFTPPARAAVERAQRLAADEGAETIEAEHLLLALTTDATEPTAAALRSLDLSEPKVRAAIDREFVDALESVGVGDLAHARSRSGRRRSTPRFGQSAKLALARTHEVAIERGDRRLDGRHLLLGLSRAEAGVMPRLLAELGIAADDIDAAIG